MLQQTVREFAAGEIAPHWREWDENQIFPKDVVRKLGELGMMGSIFPAEYGGSGLGYIEYCLIIEELSKVDPSVGLILAAHTSLCSNHINEHGTEEQKRRFLTPLASGLKIGAWSLTEPGAGSDAGGTQTTAVRDGDSWTLNGSKTFTTNGSVADIYVLMASTDKSKGHRGISAFIIERGTPGLIPGKKENKLGMRASDTASVMLENCRVPGNQLLGAEGSGFTDSLKTLDGGRISIAALSVGLAQGALDCAMRYAKQRYQFGRPIAEFQAIQFKLVDMATEIDAARLMTHRAAYLKQQGSSVTTEAAMAKLMASEIAVKAAGESVQIFGGYGFIKDYPAEKYYRDCKLTTIGEGTSEIMRVVLARQLLKHYD